MGLRLIAGLRTASGTNAAHLPIQEISSGSTVNGTATDMAGFSDLLALCSNDDGGGIAAFSLQESNTNTSGDFEDISGAAIAGISANTTDVIYADWEHPDRKRFARVVVVISIADAHVGAELLKVTPTGGDVDTMGIVAQPN